MEIRLEMASVRGQAVEKGGEAYLTRKMVDLYVTSGSFRPYGDLNSIYMYSKPVQQKLRSTFIWCVMDKVFLG